jgi:hypothetical protein
MRSRIFYQTILLITSTAFIYVGVFQRSEVSTIFMKAKLICLECIGIG